MQYKIQPIFNQILFTLHELDDSKSSILLPDGVNPVSQPYGLVLAVGPDCKYTEPGAMIILADGVGFNGYKQAGTTSFVHLISENCVIARYIPFTPALGNS